MSAHSKCSSSAEAAPGAAISRRTFARNLAATALVAGAGAGTGPAVAVAGEPAEKPTPSQQPANALGDDSPPAADLAPEEHLLAVIKHLYPHNELTEERLKEIRSQLSWYLRRSQVLSRFPLDNSDEPATTFAAYRGTDD